MKQFYGKEVSGYLEENELVVIISSQRDNTNPFNKRLKGTEKIDKIIERLKQPAKARYGITRVA